jgi:hypothetical protein
VSEEPEEVEPVLGEDLPVDRSGGSGDPESVSLGADGAAGGPDLGEEGGVQSRFAVGLLAVIRA